MNEKFQIFNDGEHCDVHGSPYIGRAVKFRGVWGKREHRWEIMYQHNTDFW